MIKRPVVLLFAILAINLFVESQVRDTIRIPDIMGYKTLKFDPHIHTVFSDGTVWPTIRVHEAWREGLDAISITDHIEYRPHRNDIVSDHNRSYELARPLAEQLDIMLIHGTEITRSMPPGHSNAIFLNDVNKLDTPEWRDAMKAAKAQDAFIFWNHPGWARQQPDTTLWWEEHTWLLENGMMHGIEVVNGSSYYPEAHRWCLEKNLTMIGTSDIHNPIGMDYDTRGGERRPMTLVFARERSAEGIREALLARRTAVYFDNKIYGREDHLDGLFHNSIQVRSVTRSANRYSISFYNPTDIPLEISKARDNDPSFQFFRTTTVPAGGHRNVIIYISDAMQHDYIELNLTVDNFLVEPGKGLPVTMKFVPAR